MNFYIQEYIEKMTEAIDTLYSSLESCFDIFKEFVDNDLIKSIESKDNE